MEYQDLGDKKVQLNWSVVEIRNGIKSRGCLHDK